MSTDTPAYCARHPKIETVLACANCGTPICPKCMVVTPVGMKCPDCGTSKGSALFRVRPERLLLAGITAFAAGAAAAAIAAIAGFFVIFIAMAYGYFAGAMILRASGMKRGLKLEMITGAGMLLGALALKLLPAILAGKLLAKGGYTAISFGAGSLIDLYFWIVLVIATSCAISKIRYL